MAGGDLHRAAVEEVGIADDLGRGLFVPGHQTDGGDIGAQVDVLGGGRDDLIGVGIGRIVAVDGLHEDAFWDAQAVAAHALDELAGGNDLAAGDAGHVRDQTLDLVDAMLFQEVFDDRHDGPFRWLLR